MSAAERLAVEGNAEEMSWRISHDTERGWFVITTRGHFSPAGFGEMQRSLVGHSEWVPGTDVLIDHRELDLGRVGFDLVQQAAAAHQANDEEVGDGFVAVVMQDLRGYGLSRMYQGVSDGRVQSRMRVFVDLDEGVAWLSSVRGRGS